MFLGTWMRLKFNRKNNSILKFKPKRILHKSTKIRNKIITCTSIKAMMKRRKLEGLIKLIAIS